MNKLHRRIQDKICTRGQLIKRSLELKAEGQAICFTNGCFDILHKGHVHYLAEAASLGDALVVGVNSDSSVKSLDKAPERPINDEESRAFLVAALEFVDLVYVFNEETPESIIQELKPNILVKGGDYDPNETDKSNPAYIVGRDHVLENGGKVHTVDLVKGYSTTETLKKMNS